MDASAEGAAGPTMAEPGRAAVRARFEKLLDGVGEWDLPDLTDKVMAILDDDPEIDRLLWVECRRQVVYALGDQVVARRRSHQIAEQQTAAVKAKIVQAAPIVLHTTTAELFDRLNARKTRMRRTNWLSHPVLVERRHHMVLGRMNRGQLDQALAVQERRLVGPIATYNMLIKVRGGLKDPAQTVEQRYTEDQLTALWEAAQTATIGAPSGSAALPAPTS